VGYVPALIGRGYRILVEDNIDPVRELEIISKMASNTLDYYGHVYAPEEDEQVKRPGLEVMTGSKWMMVGFEGREEEETDFIMELLCPNGLPKKRA
jgi:hypothetical protein